MYTFKKEERLCSKRLLDKLFHSGSSFLVYPFRVLFIADESISHPSQVVISVAKKRYRRAHDRNLVKRRIREAYRLLKQDHLYIHLKQHDKKLLVALQYVGKEIESYHFIQKKLSAVFKQIVERTNDNTQSVKMDNR